MRSDRERLLDILEAIDRIEKYVERGRAAFDQDELLQGWMVQNLQIIGEAARALSPALRDSSPAINWSAIIGMRTILVHHYFDIDTEVVWSAVINDVPMLKSQVQDLLDQNKV